MEVRERGGGLSLDVHDLKARRTSYDRASRPLEWITPALLFAIAGGVSALYARPAVPALWKSVLAAAACLHLAVGPLFWRAHKALFAKNKYDRFAGTAACLLSPWQSLRALDLLSRHLLADYHPAAATLCMAGAHRAVPILRSRLLELTYPFSGEGGERSDEARKEFSRWLEANGVDVAELLRPPERLDPGARSYCPRCRHEYVLIGGTCAECGTTLSAFE